MLRQVAGALALVVLAFQSHAAPISGQGTWETTLQPRDADPGTPGIEAYYDTDLDITWLADANYPATSGYATGGPMSWTAALAWITSLNDGNHLGFSDWRLPAVTDILNPGAFDFAYSGTDAGYNVDLSTGEMANLFYKTLGNSAAFDTGGRTQPCAQAQDPACLTNTGPFSNLQPRNYWYGADDPSDPTFAWIFGFQFGFQGTDFKTGEFSSSGHAWAVRNGDIGAVPLPAAGWLVAPVFGLLAPWVKRRHSVA
jgi:hypothetical protein